MGYVLLFALLSLEIVFALYRIRTRMIRNHITVSFRIAEAAALGTLFAASVIEWGFRYYALAAALLMAAAAGGLPLIWKKRPQAAYTPARAVQRGLGMAAVLLIALLPALLFPSYKPLPTTGGYRVETALYHFTDENRTESYRKSGGARTLAVEFWYPGQAKGSYPLIVFSHGAFGTRTSNETLFRELASHGYVVCSIDHTYHCLYTAQENGKLLLIDGGYMRELQRENAKEDTQSSLLLYKKWMGIRTADIHFVLDTVISKSKENPADAVYSLINPAKIGVIGHSLGGSAALGIGRLRSGIGAVVALESPFLCDIIAVKNDSFVFESSEYPVPVLNVYSDSSWEHLEEWPQYAENARLLSGQDTDAYTLHIAGAGHLSLTDLSLSSPMLARILNGHPSSVSAEKCLAMINESCLSFFDCFLKGVGEFTP